MSLVSWVDKAMADLDRPLWYDHDFYPTRSWRWPWRSHYRWPGTSLGGVFYTKDDEDGFKASLDVQQFKPYELTVKVVGEFVYIEGKHEERSDLHGFISRQFKRRYRLPVDVDKNALISNLSSDGILQITAPKRIGKDFTYHDHRIPVHQTYLPALKG